MTRRVVKPQPSDTGVAAFNDGCHPSFKSPYGKVGDVLWVRETFTENGLGYYRYKADFSKVDCHGIPIDGTFKSSQVPPKYRSKWRPSLFMPKAACRIFLEITDIRVERLQDISKEDAINEGIDSWIDHRFKSEPVRYASYCDFDNPKDPALYTSCPINSFETLWQSINGKDSWEKNPFVWVISFKRIEKPDGFS